MLADLYDETKVDWVMYPTPDDPPPPQPCTTVV